MNNFEVEEPILNTPYEEPALHWLIEEGWPPEKKQGRRQGRVFYRDPQSARIFRRTRGTGTVGGVVPRKPNP